jgi:hypothetical protein
MKKFNRNLVNWKGLSGKSFENVVRDLEKEPSINVLNTYVDKYNAKKLTYSALAIMLGVNTFVGPIVSDVSFDKSREFIAAYFAGSLIGTIASSIRSSVMDKKVNLINKMINGRESQK